MCPGGHAFGRGGGAIQLTVSILLPVEVIAGKGS